MHSRLTLRQRIRRTKARIYGENIIISRYTSMRNERRPRNNSQNQIKMQIFSLTMLRGKMHSASCFSMLPDVPNLWNVHFVIRGKTQIIGSIRSSWSRSANDITSMPYVKKVPSKKRSNNTICPKSKNSQKCEVQLALGLIIFECLENLFYT